MWWMLSSISLYFVLCLSDGAVSERDNTDVLISKKAALCCRHNSPTLTLPPLHEKPYGTDIFKCLLTITYKNNARNNVLHDSVTCATLNICCFTASYPNPPMLDAAVPSPNTLLAVEPMLLVNEGLEPNDAALPNAGEPPKEGGLPNTGAVPNPATEQKTEKCLQLYDIQGNITYTGSKKTKQYFEHFLHCSRVNTVTKMCLACCALLIWNKIHNDRMNTQAQSPRGTERVRGERVYWNYSLATSVVQ